MPRANSKLTESDCQLPEESVNRRPTHDSFLEAFEALEYSFVDVADWTNDDETAVILIPVTEEFDCTEYMAYLAAAVAEVRPEQYDYEWHNRGLLIRMWWD